MEKTQHPQKEKDQEEEQDSTDSAPELPSPYISSDDLASQHPSEKSGAGTPTPDQDSD